MAALIRAVGPYRIEADEDLHPFQALARAIAHQQLNGTAAKTILGRLIAHCGSGSFPTPHEIIRAPVESLRARRLLLRQGRGAEGSRGKDARQRRARTGRRWQLLSDDEIIERLTQVRGIGRWTVEMMLMFRLGAARRAAGG